MGWTGLQAHSSDRPIRISKKQFYYFYLKFFVYCMFIRKISIFFYWTINTFLCLVLPSLVCSVSIILQKKLNSKRTRKYAVVYYTTAYRRSDVAYGGATWRVMFEKIIGLLSSVPPLASFQASTPPAKFHANPSKFPRFISENDVPGRYSNWHRIADKKWLE